MKPSIVIPALLSLLSCAYSGLLSKSTNSAWEGSVQLISDSRKTVVHEQYLEIEEEVEITAAASNRGVPADDQKKSIKLIGTIELPAGSVLCGAVLWDGTRLLKANLKTKFDSESEITDSINHNTDWTPSPTDPMLLAMEKRKFTPLTDSYLFQLYPVKWGETRHLRIRYLVPAVNGSMTVRGAFSSAVTGGVPENFTIRLSGTKGVTAARLKTSAGTSQYPLSETPLELILTSSLNKSMQISQADFYAKGRMYTTSIDTGLLAGEYLQYFSSVPEELFREAGIQREVVFLWRWENENSLVDWNNQSKYLSAYGRKALEQANQITGCIANLLDARAGAALYHDRTDSASDTSFSISYKGSASADSLMNYLAYLTRGNGENIIADISGREVKDEMGGDSLSAMELDSICKAGAKDFEIAVKAVKTMFSPDKKIIKHIVLITAGKRKSDSNIIYKSSLDSLDGVTVSGYGIDSRFADGYWPGVDLKRIASDRKLLDGGESVYGMRIPAQRAANITMYLKSSLQSQGFPITTATVNGVQTYSNVAFSGHAAGSWFDQVVWKAQDLSGKELAEVVQTPLRTKSVNDTDLIMLWGASSSRPYSERIKTGSVGFLVGFVDESYSLLAMPYDSVSKSVQQEIEKGEDIGNLTRDEIFGPVDNTAVLPLKKKTAAMGIHGALASLSGVDIQLNIGAARSAELIICDLKGRVIARFTHEELAGKMSVHWDGSGAHGLFIARLVIDGRETSALKFTI